LKQCPTCRRTYPDNTMVYCLDDGSSLVTTPDLQKTLRVSLPPVPDHTPPLRPLSEAPARSRKWPIFVMVALLLIGLLAAGVGILILGYSRMSAPSEVTNEEPRSNQKPQSGSSPPPSPTPRTAQALVGTWRTNVDENGRQMEITVTFLSTGNTRYVFKERGQTTTDTATWEYSDATLFEHYSHGASGKGAIKWIDDNNFEITIIDNGVPAYNGLKRQYHRIS